MRKASAAAALITLAIAWLVLARAETSWPFTQHMTMHMLVVAVAAPLLALALPRIKGPAILISLLELAAVWGWHAPALHHLARHTTLGLIAEQLTFFTTGTWLWASALSRAGTGLVALLLTSMHMTLLGALLALATRPLYAHGTLEDQHLGGAVMLLFGGAVYLLGGLLLARSLLSRPLTPALSPTGGEGARS